ncbi:MAG: heme lyase CcmF/NrfE family subunit [Arenicella sp.]
MLAEIAQICLILALCVAVVQGVLSLLGAHREQIAWMNLSKPATYVQWSLVAIAYGLLTHAFIIHDFSVAYVANNSNTEQPLIYRISGVWGAHEGSLLLWVLIQCTWSALVASFSRQIPMAIIARVLGVLSLINVGFLSFMLFTSNPFDRFLPAPLEGRELNPLLQDPGLAIHPPMLYIGYVGFSVAFAFAISALLSGKMDSQWARWVRPWTGAAWLFLTIGITLGSWWAYYELGWGGWWFWDPVENASFMPWLVGTALVHCLAVTEKRGAFVAWTVLLAIFTFSLSLLGTFLVRSGILTSVHAFASDPTRGLYILIFLSIVIGGSLALYAFRGSSIRSTVGFTLFSKETSLLLNNVFLLVAAFMVFLGTLFPLVIEAIGQGKISVGAPYFDLMFAVLTIPLAILVGVGAMTRWKQDQLNRFYPAMALFAVLSISISSAITAYLSHRAQSDFSFGAMGGVSLTLWITLWTVHGILDRGKNRKGVLNKLRQPAAFWGMSIAHFGVAVFILGVTHVNTYSLDKDLTMIPGDTYEMAEYQFKFAGIEQKREQNYLANEGRFIVSSQQQEITTLYPQKRYYRSGGNPLTEAAINTSLTRDLYVSLGEQINPQTQQWSVRFYYRSYVVCIWLGGFIMALGGLIAIFDRRYRKSGEATA